MFIKFELDSEDPKKNPDQLRAAAAFLLHLVGDLDQSAIDVQVATGDTPKPYVSQALKTAYAEPSPPPTSVNSDQGDGQETGYPRSADVINFPVPPPPPPITTAGSAAPSFPPPPSVATFVADVNIAASATNPNLPPPTYGYQQPVPPPPPAVPATTASAAGAVGSSTVTSAVSTVANTASTVEVDSAGMPWDERIHQKDRNKKQDGTWKLRKQRGATPEQVTAFQQLVQQVTKEHSARTNGVVPLTPAERVAALNSGQYPVAATVSLPGTMPVPPPPPNVSPAPAVPVPPPISGAPMPPPPIPAAGVVSGQMTFRQLMDKIIAATQAHTITPQQVAKCCTDNGAPSLQQLSFMPHLVEAVNVSLDMVLAGLS